jgi:predicted transcriptional regulator
MAFKTVSFRADEEKLKELDELAKAQHRDRTFLLNEAIDSLLKANWAARGLVDRMVFRIDNDKDTENGPRKPGLFKGVFEVGASFDDPLPEDELRLWSGE